MPYLELESGRLYFERSGSGPPLVFAHGLGGSHASWWQQVPHFRDRFTCVTFSHRGFHPSEGTAGPALYGQDLLALLDHLGLDTAVLVAQSMGGWTCTALALVHPERVRALVLCDTVGVLKFPDEAPWPDPSGLFARGIHPAAGERMAREQPALHFLYQELDGFSVGLDKGALRMGLHELRNVPAERLRGHPFPILWIWGEEDASIPVEMGYAARDLFPEARFELVRETGHSVYFERPETFNRILDEFLAATGD